MTLPRALLLDSTFLVAYERELSPRLAQAVVVQAITTGRLLIVPAVSLLVAGTELVGCHPDLSWLLNDPAGPVQVLGGCQRPTHWRLVSRLPAPGRWT